jgi:molecular chaperone GrpE
MGKTNGKTENTSLDLEHELPSGEGNEEQSTTTAGSLAGEAPGIEAELQKVKAERDTLLDRLARMQAEFDNARKRAAREQQEFRDFAAADAIKSLLPVIDSFDRALQSKSQPGDFRSGIELIYKQLQDTLAKLGVQPIRAKGEPFDPRFHEAIEMVETTEAPDHHVFEELQRGYKYKDRLLRPAMVRVAKNPGS